MEVSLQASNFYSYLNSVVEILFLGVCGSSIIDSNIESTLIRCNADMNSVHRLQLIC